MEKKMKQKFNKNMTFILTFLKIHRIFISYEDVTLCSNCVKNNLNSYKHLIFYKF